MLKLFRVFSCKFTGCMAVIVVCWCNATARETNQHKLTVWFACHWLCDGLPVERMDIVKSLCLHFHQGTCLTLPFVWRHRQLALGLWQHSRPQTLPAAKHHCASLQYGCKFRGMRIPQAYGAAKKARTALQPIYDKYLRHIYGVKCTTPSAMLLEGLLLLSLHVFQWQRTLEFWNKIAASPAGSIFHTILLDNIDDAVPAKNFSGSIATCLQSIGQPMAMPRDSGVITVLEVVAIVKGLHQHLVGTHDDTLHCPRVVLG